MKPMIKYRGGKTKEIYAISPDYYEYLVSILYNDPNSEGLHGGMIDLGVTEPIRYFSNIKGGIGILAAYTLYETELDVMNIVGKFPE